MATEATIHFYGKIEKFETSADETLTVSGIASSESTDSDGEVITAEAMRKALPAYLQKGTVREMHDGIAAGKPLSAYVDDEGKTHFTALIADKSTIQKIKLGILKGFSIGGQALKKVGNRITEILLRDISVVDRPANPESLFEIIKFDKSPEKSMKKCEHCDKDVDGDMKEHMEKCGSYMQKKKDERIEAIFSTVDTLVKGFEALQAKLNSATPALPAELTKMAGKVDDLEKRLDAANAANLDIERGAIVSKMLSQGRVAYKDDGTAYTPDDLRKMEMPLLKVLSKNAQILPLEAKAVYKGAGEGPDTFVAPLGKDGKAITGEALTEAGYVAAGYSDLNKMMAAHKLQ